jgi:putative glucuronide porin
MVRSKVYYYPDVSIGLHTSGPVNPRTYQYDTYRPQYLTSTLYRNKLDTYALSVSWQEDVAAQIMTKASQRYAVSADGRSYFKPEWLGLYAKLNGVSSGEHSAKDTYVLGAKLSYINDTGNGFVAVGKAGPKFSWLSGVDTDISYTYDLSIDRNHSNMFSWQVGYLWNLPNDMLLGLAQLYTDGHEDRHNNVKIRGAATGIIAGYNPRSGAMKGLRSMLILSSARESREGSQLGDHLDYFDIKLNLQYDFNLR